MPSRRSAITMSDAELARFFEEERVLTCATLGPGGRPHLMPLWYVARGLVLHAWTFAKSQKVRNLERDARATVQVEAGDAYGELRGAMLECEVTIERDPARVAVLGLALLRRYRPADDTAAGRVAMEAQALKRVALAFHPTRIVSWDHRKL